MINGAKTIYEVTSLDVVTTKSVRDENGCVHKTATNKYGNLYENCINSFQTHSCFNYICL